MRIYDTSSLFADLYPLFLGAQTWISDRFLFLETEYGIYAFKTFLILDGFWYACCFAEIEIFFFAILSLWFCKFKFLPYYFQEKMNRSLMVCQDRFENAKLHMIKTEAINELESCVNQAIDDSKKVLPHIADRIKSSLSMSWANFLGLISILQILSGSVTLRRNYWQWEIILYLFTLLASY